MHVWRRLRQPLGARRYGSTLESSWSRQEVVLHQIGDAPGPRFVGVATNVDAVDERQFSSPDVGHVDVDVEDEVRDFLDNDPRDGIGAELFAVDELATAAGADLWTGGNFAGGVRRYGHEMIPAGGLELCFEDGRDQGDARPLRLRRRLGTRRVVA